MPVIDTSSRGKDDSSGSDQGWSRDATWPMWIVGVALLAIVIAVIVSQQDDVSPYRRDRIETVGDAIIGQLKLWTGLIVGWALSVAGLLVAAVWQLAGIRRALESRRG